MAFPRVGPAERGDPGASGVFVSAAQSNGGKGQSQDAGRKGGQATRPGGSGQRGQGAPARGQGGSARGQGAGRGPTGRGPGGRSPAGRQIGGSGPRPSRLTPSTIGIGAVAVVVVVVVAIIAFKVIGGGGGGASGSNGIQPPTVTTASATVLHNVESVPASVQNAVGAWQSVGAQGLTAPAVKSGQPALKLGSSSLPAALYVGGEFCPYCAATRWSLLMAFSKFGTFSGVQETTSSPWDVYPSTPTFTFAHTSYTSQYVHFVPKEYLGQDTTGVNTHGVLQPLTKQEQRVYTKYDTVNGQTGVPFVDIDNKVMITGAPIDPQLLAGMTQQQVASTLSNPSSNVTKAIVGTANALIAGVCNVDGQQPATVCSDAGVQAAGKALGLG